MVYESRWMYEILAAWWILNNFDVIRFCIEWQRGENASGVLSWRRFDHIKWILFFLLNKVAFFSLDDPMIIARLVVIVAFGTKYLLKIDTRFHRSLTPRLFKVSVNSKQVIQIFNVSL